MSTVADLSGGTAKVLLALLARGGAWGDTATMLAEAGVSKPVYLAAKRDLDGPFHPLLVKFLDQAGQNSFPSEQNGAEGGKFSGELPLTPRQRCAAADRLGQGQADAVVAGFAALYPQEPALARYQAKELLLLAPAEDVYDALDMARGRGIDRPLSYVRRVLANRPQAGVVPASAAAAPRPQAGPAGGEDHTGELAEWTAEWERRVQASEQALRRAGYGHLLAEGEAGQR